MPLLSTGGGYGPRGLVPPEWGPRGLGVEGSIVWASVGTWGSCRRGRRMLFTGELPSVLSLAQKLVVSEAGQVPSPSCIRGQ